MSQIIKCDMCGSDMKVYPSQLGYRHHFCSKKCMADFSSRDRNPALYATLKDYRNISRHMTEVNERLNPVRMTPKVREKLRKSKLGTGNGLTYEKTYGKATHRLAAEEAIGRPLRQGEVVHHIDGNKRNNSPENLMIFESQAEHARYHMQLRKEKKEVMPK